MLCLLHSGDISFFAGQESGLRLRRAFLPSVCECMVSEILTFKTNDTFAEIGEIFTNEFYRPMFPYQRPIFKYPSNLNPGAFGDWMFTNTTDTKPLGDHQ